jgi:hypothetical protein
MVKSLEAAGRAWQTTPDASKDDALLMGLGLAQAQSWLLKRPEDLLRADREFIRKTVVELGIVIFDFSGFIRLFGVGSVRNLSRNRTLPNCIS